MNYSSVNNPKDYSPLAVLFTGDAIYFRGFFYPLESLGKTQ